MHIINQILFKTVFLIYNLLIKFEKTINKHIRRQELIEIFKLIIAYSTWMLWRADKSLTNS